LVFLKEFHDHFLQQYAAGYSLKVTGVEFSSTSKQTLGYSALAMKSSPHPSQANLVVAYLEQERKRFSEQRRIVYIIVGSIGVLLLLYDLYNQVVSDNSLQRTVNIINDALFAITVLVFVFLGYTRGVKLERLERSILVILAFQSFVFNSLAPYLFNHSIQKVFRETIADDVWLLVLVCAVALHLLERWRTFAATSFYLASFGVTMSYLFLRVADGDSNLMSLVIQNYLAGGMVLAFLYVLARYRDNAQRLSLQYEMLERVAFLDALTGLPNRRRMYDTIVQHLELARRYNTPFCVALLDIDHFKRINDTFGHLKGDEVLQKVAGVLRADFRSVDQLGRWGGEEFLLVLPQTNLKEGVAAVERSRQAVEVQVRLEGQSVTLSCGVAHYLPGDDITTFLQRSDDALYRAKKQGRNRVVSSEEKENSRLSRERLFL
jgi:diguanylate cyclase (GGDEF)-like protein